ncbi:hypothetical protein L1987_31318 [Smallanthus sonchifolius]|uniref:Uncharacterized protein n=1 Tax=Smallanthus sonchifolius TaxID=185202 RepID=A0ACB9I4M0_9ASTR|nr:hypothetical protein L1987_31318 [Smallanthus sonchifolius]
MFQFIDRVDIGFLATILRSLRLVFYWNRIFRKCVTTFTMEEVSLHCGFIHDKLTGTSDTIWILGTCADRLPTFKVQLIKELTSSELSPRFAPRIALNLVLGLLESINDDNNIFQAILEEDQYRVVYSIRGGIVLSKRHYFSIAMLIVFSVALILFKDIPDIKGDEMHGIKSLASQIGPEQMFWSCIWLLGLAYGVSIIVGATSSSMWSKYATILGHLAAVLALWVRTKSVDLKNMASISSMYLFLWKLFYVEYLLLPLILTPISEILFSSRLNDDRKRLIRWLDITQ